MLRRRCLHISRCHFDKLEWTSINSLQKAVLSQAKYSCVLKAGLYGSATEIVRAYATKKEKAQKKDRIEKDKELGQNQGITWGRPKENPRHLLRWLLRESTYLPDKIARKYFRLRILERFRANANIEKTLRPELVDDRLRRLHQRAKQWIRFMKRAYQGYSEQLHKTLLLAYGRINPRKAVLLDPLLRKDDFPPKDLISLTWIQRKFPENVRMTLPAYTNMLQKLLLAQGIRKSRVAPQIPMENIWKRSFPVKRAANLVRECYAAALEAALPPIPDKEWRYLRDVSAGKIWDAPPERRSRGTRFNEKEPWGIEELEKELKIKEEPRSVWVRMNKPHELTQRHMQRRWVTVFKMCPRKYWDKKSEQWQFEFGRGRHTWIGSTDEVRMRNKELHQMLNENVHAASEANQVENSH